MSAPGSIVLTDDVERRTMGEGRVGASSMRNYCFLLHTNIRIIACNLLTLVGLALRWRVSLGANTDT